MIYNRPSDQGSSGRRTVEVRKRRRCQLRPALLALEERTLLSSIVVNNPTDTPVVGQIDLRQAIGQANMNGGAETINFDSTVFSTPQTITLTGGQLELSDTTGTETITGPAAGVTVSGGGQSRVFQVDAECHGVHLGTDDHRRQHRGYRQRRRPVQRRHDHADQLHRQRQLRLRDYGGGVATTARPR